MSSATIRSVKPEATHSRSISVLCLGQLVHILDVLVQGHGCGAYVAVGFKVLMRPLPAAFRDGVAVARRAGPASAANLNQLLHSGGL